MEFIMKTGYKFKNLNNTFYVTHFKKISLKTFCIFYFKRKILLLHVINLALLYNLKKLLSLVGILILVLDFIFVYRTLKLKHQNSTFKDIKVDKNGSEISMYLFDDIDVQDEYSIIYFNEEHSKIKEVSKGEYNIIVRNGTIMSFKDKKIINKKIEDFKIELSSIDL